MTWMRRLADRLRQQTQTLHPAGALPVFWPAIPPRNVVFLLIVLTHGFARVLTV